MSESSTIQKQSSDYLEAKGYSVFITVSSNKSGIGDIVACSPVGKYVEIETKLGNNKPSTLQVNRINEIRARYGRAGVVSTLQELKILLNKPLPLPQIKTTTTKVNL